MFSLEGPLPVKLEPFLDESGMGYCLRSISSNGANLHALRRLLEIRPSTQISKKHASVIALCTGVSGKWLDEALTESSSAAQGVGRYFGHSFYLHNHLCEKTPQVCAKCIHQYGYCRAIWGVALSTYCLKHSCTLIRACQKCSASLRWDRRSIDVGHCGHYIAAAELERPLNAYVYQWQQLIESSFLKKDSEFGMHTWERVLSSMSLGGACTVISAFGLNDTPYKPIHTAQTIRSKPASEWQVVIARAIERIDGLETGRLESTDLAQVVAQPILMRLLQTSSESMDYQVCMKLLKRVFEIDGAQLIRGRYPGTGQLSLFADE